MKDLLDFLVKKAKKEEKFFKNPQKYALLIKKEAQKMLKKPKVYLFGSILKKNEIPRDIDVLVISEDFKKKEKKRDFIFKVLEKLKSDVFEIHCITPEEYKNWYSFFIKRKKRI